MSEPAPWTEANWLHAAGLRLESELAAVGRPAFGPVETVKAWGRACLRTVPTEAGTVWVKHGYGLPPGEERVLAVLARRWPDRLPSVVATWPGAVAMDPLGGSELLPEHPVEAWQAVAGALGELAAGEHAHAEDWLALGVRDRRPAAWEPAVAALLESPVLNELEADVRAGFESFLPDFIERYQAAFEAPPTLVHQDSGCCNVHLSENGPVIFDWADVVVGHPVFSCDRLLDQAPTGHREPVIEAFRAPLDLSRAEFDAMRRSNVLHEVLRYHDELAHLAVEDDCHRSLSESVRSQLRVLVEHERTRR